MSTVYAPVSVLHARMMTRVERSGSCLVFTGASNSRGYGVICSGRKGKSVLTHRLAVMHRDGQIPDGLTVDHMCELKRCVNPEHLQVVTRAENARLRFTRHQPAPIETDGPAYDLAALLGDFRIMAGHAA